jgi:hypothetical protein
MVAFAFKNLGYQTSLEKVLSCGTRVDVLASNKDKYSYAIEVELDSNLNVHNKLRCLEEVNALIVLSKDQQVLENTKTMLKQANADQLSRIGFYQIGQFIDGLRQNIITEIFRNGDLDKK